MTTTTTTTTTCNNDTNNDNNILIIIIIIIIIIIRRKRLCSDLNERSGLRWQPLSNQQVKPRKLVVFGAHLLRR